MGGSASCFWPVALKVFEKPFGLCAMGEALADKDLNVRLFTGRLDGGASKRAGQSGGRAPGRKSVSDHDSVATQDVN
jgi:hypothetical protein